MSKREKLEDDNPMICPFLYGGAIASGTPSDQIRPGSFRCMGPACHMWSKNRGCSVKTRSSDPGLIFLFVLILFLGILFKLT